MTSDEANKRVKLTADLVRAGGAYDWKTSPIGETREARLTDPERIQRVSQWWKAAEPDSLAEFKRVGQNFLDNLKKFAARAHDDKDSEQQSIAPIKDKKRKKKASAAGDDAEDFESYLPKPDDDAMQWLYDLATRLPMTPARMPWRNALQHYVNKITRGKKGTPASKLDMDIVRSIVRMLCEEEEAA